ncbi:transposase [Streptomyces sp. NPDC059802]|uniref:transposase n=1 Tax=Streptomyces sp. NPDC059802 TaxID=3346952 RepID=UPI00365F9EE2
MTALSDGSYLSQIVAARDKNRRADPATVRVIEYILGPPGEGTVYRLVTTLLDPATAPATELAALYAERWEIETTLDEIKTHLGGPASSCAPSIRPGSSRRSSRSSSCTTRCATSCTRRPSCRERTRTGCPSPAPCASSAGRPPARRDFPPPGSPGH